MLEFIAKHQGEIAGTLSGFDRLLCLSPSADLSDRGTC